MDLLSSNPIPVENFYIIYNVNERKRVGRDWVFPQAGRAASREFPRSYHCTEFAKAIHCTEYPGLYLYTEYIPDYALY